MSVKVDILGLEDLKKSLMKLPITMQQNSVKKAATFAATPLHKRTKSEAPEDWGALKESLIKKVKLYRQSGVVDVIIGVDADLVRFFTKNKDGEPRKHRPEKYLHLVQLGTAHSAPNRFMDRAARGAETQVAQRFESKMKRDLPKDIERVASKKIR